MADKKKPPFHNESLGAFHCKQHFHDTMEVFIETLTGTCFQLQVFPLETVISVKTKIQRLEGIPIPHQHLIWNNLELDNEYSLRDYNIAEGCTLKLVLAMRGGPINTRRVAVEQPVNGVANLTESSRIREDGSWKKTLPSKPVTFLVYRDGDQLNFFRVVDGEGDPLTSFSGYSSDCSLMYNMFAEEEEYENGTVTAAEISTLENSITMNKMKLLKAKMEDLNINKKPKQLKKMKSQPPVDRHTDGKSVVRPSMRPHQRFFSILPQINHSLQPNTQLPTIGSKESKSPSPLSACTTDANKFVTMQARPIFSPSSCFMLPEEELQDSCPLEPQSSDVSSQTNGVSTGTDSPLPFSTSPLLLQQVGTNSCWPHGLADRTQFGNTTLHIQLSSHSPSIPSRPIPQLFEFTGSSPHPIPPVGTHAFLKSPIISPHHTNSFSTSRLAHVQDIQKVSLSKCSEKTSKTQERCITKIANQASNELVGMQSNTELASSSPRHTSRERLVPSASLGLSLTSANSSGLELLGSTSSSVPENIKLLRNNFSKKMSPFRKTAASFLPTTTLESSGGASTLRKLSTPSYYLPPIKVANVDNSKKKKNTKVCFCCGKKTGLTTSYECRCGNNFCATHRYAETHNCTYDYKTSGRRFLQKTNPIIRAPKLPKI